MKETDNIKFFENSYNFLKLLGTEIYHSIEIYGKEDSKTLRNYYSDWLRNKNYFSFASYYTALRQMHLLKYIKKDMKILDAGCGTGSDVILFGVYGGEVLGIDIRDTLLKLTQKRINYYEKIFNTKLNINFKQSNIFKISGLFDIIWVNEAISHIEPADNFISLCFKILKKGGKLIIGDTNKLNPIFYYKAKKEQKRRGGMIIKIKDPKTGEDVSYANERLFSIYEIKALLSNLFKNIEVFPIGYIPFFFYNKLPKISRKIEKIASHYIPIIKYISGSYVLVCTKI